MALISVVGGQCQLRGYRHHYRKHRSVSVSWKRSCRRGGRRPQNDGVSEVFLGYLTIQAGLEPGETTVFSVSSSDPINGATFTNDSSYNLDNSDDPNNPPGASSLYYSAAFSKLQHHHHGRPRARLVHRCWFSRGCC